MNRQELLNAMNAVRDGTMTPEDAVKLVDRAPFEDIGFAKIDHHRQLRNGASEVIYGAGKTAEQIAAIAGRIIAAGGRNVLITRMDADKAAQVEKTIPLCYDPVSRVGVANRQEHPLVGSVVVASGGTSDLAVCEEAALTAETLGSRVTRLYDVGVAGLHRLLAHVEELQSARCVVAVAGMEGALFEMGFTDFRVRLFHGAARLQLPCGQMARALDRRAEIRAALAPWFDTVMLDLKDR